MKLITLVFLIFSISAFGQSSTTLTVTNGQGSGSGGANPSYEIFDITTYGASSDSSSGDNTFSIQQAIDAAHVRGGVVYIPAGYYRTNQLETYINVKIIGDGIRNSFLYNISSDTVIAMHNLNDALNGVINWDIASTLFEDFYVDGRDIADVGIYLDEAANFQISRVAVYKCRKTASSVGLFLQNSLIGEIDASRFHSNSTGIKAQAYDPHATTHVKITNSTVYLAPKWAIDWSGGGMLTVQGCDLGANGTLSDTATGVINYHNNIWPGGLLAIGNWMEANLGTMYNIVDNVTVQNLFTYPLYTTHSIINCQDLGYQYSFADRNVYVKGNYQRLTIINSTLNNAATTIVCDGNSTTNIQLFGSYIEDSLMRGGSVLTTIGN